MRTSLSALARRKHGEPLSMVTAYDYTSAQLADAAGLDLILVGDSLGMVVLGYDSTLPVTLEDMIRHGRAVTRGAEHALVVVDLPFTASTDEPTILTSSARLLAETGAQSIKLEGGAYRVPAVRTLVQHGIPVMGHLGYTPQSVNTLGTRVQGRDEAAARTLIDDALALQEAGAWAVVLELVPAELAAEVTRAVDIPTIGIGAGPDTDGQVQVWHDLLGLYEDFQPRHARRFGTLGDAAREALAAYRTEVVARSFPAEENLSHMDAEVLARVTGSGPAGEGQGTSGQSTTA